MATITELLLKAEQSINFSESPRLDAEILFCYVMQFNRSKIYSHPDATVPDDKSALFKSLIKKRQEGHPVAHLTGKKEFWSLEFAINKDTLIPRPETELAVETALQIIPADATFNILDLGTGSGAIAVAVAFERPGCKIVATDINKNALEMAQENAKTHKLENIKFFLSDWYLNIPPQSFDLIISNPPYVKKDDEYLSQGDVRFESHLALCADLDGMQAINIILKHAGSYLACGAHLIIEHAYNQKKLVQKAFLENNFKEIKTFQDLSGQDRITLGHYSGQLP